MPGVYKVDVEQPSQQEVLEHAVRAGLCGQELNINGYHLLPHQVQMIATLVANLWPAWYQRMVDLERWHQGK